MEQAELEGLLTDQIFSTMDAMASMVGWKKHRKNTPIAYASSPITSGPRMYQLMEQLGVTTRDQIPKDKFQKQVMMPNIEAGEEFAQKVRDTKEYAVVISPATFFAKRWKQEHYMTLWRTVIENLPTAVHYNNGTIDGWSSSPAWAYSDCCVEEYNIGVSSKKNLFSGVELVELPLEEALTKITGAMDHIQRLGIDSSTLFSLHRTLKLREYTARKEG